MSLQELGSQAYQKALFADYKGALQILDKAIVKFPRDEKLLNNRCFCLLQIKDYQRALQDAEKMVANFPRYSKAYFRNAEALAGLRRFTEAEKVLNRLLQIEPRCSEAQELLSRVQSQNKVRRVSNLSTLSERANGAGKGFGKNSTISDDIYYSDEDLNNMLDRAIAFENNVKKKKKKGPNDVPTKVVNQSLPKRVNLKKRR